MTQRRNGTCMQAAGRMVFDISVCLPHFTKYDTIICQIKLLLKAGALFDDVDDHRVKDRRMERYAKKVVDKYCCFGTILSRFFLFFNNESTM